jgi:hypothetical protein
MLSLDELVLATPLPRSPEEAPKEREFKPLVLYHEPAVEVSVPPDFKLDAL